MNLLHKTGLLLGFGLILLFAWDVYLYYRPKKNKDETEKL
jgi:hypothetical protein